MAPVRTTDRIISQNAPFHKPFDALKTVAGIGSAINQGHRQMSTLALKSVSFSFSMFFHNLFLYNTLKEQSEKDSLTGLQNRNRYERDLQELRQIYRNSAFLVFM